MIKEVNFEKEKIKWKILNVLSYIQYVLVGKSVQFIVNDKVVIICLLKIDIRENHGKAKILLLSYSYILFDCCVGIVVSEQQLNII